MHKHTYLQTQLESLNRSDRPYTTDGWLDVCIYGYTNLFVEHSGALINRDLTRFHRLPLDFIIFFEIDSVFDVLADSDFLLVS